MEEKAFWEKRNFIQSVWFELPEEKRGYPFDIEAVAECGKIELEEPVTILTRRKRQRKIDDIGGNRSGSRL